MAIPHTQKSLLLGVYFLYKIRWLWQYFFIQNDVVFCLCNIFNIKILIFCLQKPKNVRREFVLVLNSVCLSVSGFKCFPIHFLTDLKNFWIVFFLAVQCTYALALRILYPEVQDRVQQGLDRMAARGGRQHITMADKVNLPYVEATLNEVCGALVIWPPVGRPASCARSCRLGWNDFAIFEIGNIAADQFKLIAEFCHAAKFSFWKNHRDLINYYFLKICT